jgi:DNA-directed RNA polymerase subunit M/transcription elongation factor TFIIS
MDIFNEKRIEAMFSGKYECPVCGSLMEFEDEWETVLVCPQCGESIELDRYGFTDDEYDELYPMEDELDD